MCSLEWLGRVKCRATGFDVSLSSFSTSRRCSRNRSPSRLPVSPMYSFLHNVYRKLPEKVAYLEEIDKFWWFFTKCPTFCNIFLKIGSKP